MNSQKVESVKDAVAETAKAVKESEEKKTEFDSILNNDSFIYSVEEARGVYLLFGVMFSLLGFGGFFAILYIPAPCFIITLLLYEDFYTCQFAAEHKTQKLSSLCLLALLFLSSLERAGYMYLKRGL